MANQNALQQKVLEKLLKGVKHQKAGEIEKAQRCYQQALKKAPKHPEALNLLGVTYRQLGFPKRAADYIQRAIDVQPREPSFYANLARARLDMGAEPDSLLDACDKALSLAPGEREAANIRGIALTRKGALQEANAQFVSLLTAFPDYIDAYLNYGVLLVNAGQVEEAIGVFTKAIGIAPDNPNLFIQRARARQTLDQYAECVAELSEALKRFPGNSDVAHEAARLMFKMNESDKGVILAEAALRSDPDNHHKALTLGAVYQMNRQPERALETLLLAKRLAPEDGTIDWNLSLAYLANGDLANGWALHKARFRTDTTQARARQFDVPEWTGEDISDKTILVWSDQGLGDVLRTSTMLPDLAGRAGKIIVETHEKATGVLQHTFPKMICRPPEMDADLRASASDFDLHVNITDLARLLRADLDSFGRADTPVLSFEKERARDYLARLNGHDEKPVIGVSWRSGKMTAQRARYYLSASAIAPLMEARDAVFVNLQYLADGDELAVLKNAFPERFRVLEDVDLFDDLSGAAALTACCDLVVSANTSVSDMAGLLGVPSIRFGQQEPTLLLGQDNPPWYPTMTYMHPYSDRPCAEFVPEIIGEMDRQLEGWTPVRRNGRLDL